MMKKKLLTVLICSFALAFCISGPVLGAEDPPQGEGYHEGETEEGNKENTDSPNPNPEDESNKETENNQENTDTDHKTDSGDKQEGQDPDQKPDPDPEPEQPKPDEKPEGISVDPQTQKMIVDISLMKVVQIQGNNISFSYLDGRDYKGSTTIPAAGCIFRKAPGTGTSVTFLSPSVPILLEGASTGTPYTYQVTGNLENVSSLQVNGILWFPQSASFSGNITASRVSSKNKLTIKSGKISLGALDAAEIAVEGGDLTIQDTIQTTGPLSITGGTVLCKGAIQSNGAIQIASEGWSVTARQITAGDQITLSKKTGVTANALSGTSLNLTENSSFSLSKADSALYGQGVLSGDISISGGSILSADGDIQARNITISSGSFVNNRSLSASGTLSVPNGGTLQGGGTIQTKDFSDGGIVKASNFTATNPIQIKSNMEVTGTISAPALTVEGTLNAGKIQSNQLKAPKSLAIPNTELAIGTGGIDVQGDFKASGGSCSGPVTAASVTFTKPFQGSSITTSTGGVTAQQLTLSGALRSKDGISLSGPFRGKSITAEKGNITSGSSGTIVQADSVEALKGAVNLSAASKVSGRIYGETGVSLNESKCGSIYAEGPVTLKGKINTGNITAKAFTTNSETYADKISCTTGSISASSVLNCDSLTASGALTVRGRISAKGKVTGKPITTPSGGIIHASSVSGMDNGYRGKLTIITPFGSNKTVYIELKLSGDTAKGFDVKTDKNGKIYFENLAPGNYTVYAQNGSNGRKDTVKVPSNGTATLDLRSSAGTNSSGQTTGGSSFFDEDEFWEDVSDSIRSAKKGATVRVSASKADTVPTWILEELKDRPITLKLTHGRDSVTINGKNMYKIPSNRVYYLFEDLADLYEFPPDHNDIDDEFPVVDDDPLLGGNTQKPNSSSSSVATPPPAPAPSLPTNPVTPPPAVPAPVVPGISGGVSSATDPDESSDLEDDTSSDTEISEPEDPEEPDDLEDPEKPEDPKEPDQPVETKKPVSAVPVMIAIGLLMLSLGGISIGYVVYKRTQENKDSNDLP